MNKIDEFRAIRDDVYNNLSLAGVLGDWLEEHGLGVDRCYRR